MRWALVAAATAFSLVFGSAAAAFDGKTTLGFGRVFANDAIGDGRDRWRTGAYTVSWVRGTEWTGELPERFGEIVEYRFRGEIIAPSNLAFPSPRDRRWVGALTLGVHSHFRRGASQFAVGVDAVATGPMTGLGAFQRFAHEVFGGSDPTLALRFQIPNAIHPTLRAEAARSFGAGALRFRPFVAAEAGVETLLRIGGEVLLGQFEQGALMLRDVTTGHLYPGVRGTARGFGAVLGADLAAVGSSAYLPAGGVVQLDPLRLRARAGVQWQGRRLGAFYGLTYLGPEFRGQRSGQLMGVLRLSARF